MRTNEAGWKRFCNSVTAMTKHISPPPLDWVWQRYRRLSPDKNHTIINKYGCFFLTKKIHSFASRVARPSRSQFDQRYRQKTLWRPQHQSWRTPHWGPDKQYWSTSVKFCGFFTSIFALSWSFSSMILYMSYSATSALSSGSCVIMLWRKSLGERHNIQQISTTTCVLFEAGGASPSSHRFPKIFGVTSFVSMGYLALIFTISFNHQSGGGSRCCEDTTWRSPRDSSLVAC